MQEKPQPENVKGMKMEAIPKVPDDDELLPEYDLSQLQGGVRGKYFDRYHSRLHLVRLEPDLAVLFPTEASVNNALRLLAELAKRQTITANSSTAP